LGLNQQVYVIKIDVANNTVIVGPKDTESLLEDHCLIKDLHRINPDYSIDQLPSDIQVKIRYRQALQGAKLTKSDNQTLRVDFDQAQRAVAPGQICVIYRQGEVLGSGVIL
jgi:tRNA-specific 2-thiouridylase